MTDLLTGEFVQLNRINKSAMFGPAFAPGITKDGGMFKYRLKDWYKPVEPAPARTDSWSRNQIEAEPPGILNNTLWPDNVPLGYPFRKMEFDEGVTYIKKGSESASGAGVSQSDKTFISVLAGIAFIAFIVSRTR